MKRELGIWTSYIMTVALTMVSGGLYVHRLNQVSYQYSTRCSYWHWVVPATSFTHNVLGRTCIQVRRDRYVDYRSVDEFKLSGTTATRLVYLYSVSVITASTGGARVTENTAGVQGYHVTSKGLVLASYWRPTLSQDGHRVYHGKAEAVADAARNAAMSGDVIYQTGALNF